MTADEEIRKQFLENICDSFIENNWMVVLNARPLVEDIADGLNIDESDARYHLERLSDDYLIDHNPAMGGNGTVKILPRTIDQYERLSGETVIPEDDCLSVLEVLYERERNAPRQPSVSRDDLLDETSLSEGELDRVIWYMNEKGLVDARTHLGTPAYNSAKIDRAGRQLYEQRT